MAIDIFNLNYYVLQASASDPKNSVTLADTSGYALSASPADRVFVQQTTRVFLTGGIVPPLTVQRLNYCMIDGTSPDRNEVTTSTMKLFQVTGGQRLPQAKVFAQRMYLYEITS